MRKVLYSFTTIYFLLIFVGLDSVQAQTSKPSFSGGWYHVLNGNNALEVVADSTNYRVRLAKKSKSPKQLWKLVIISENEHITHYYLTNQWLGKNKALTVVFEEEGHISLMMNSLDKDDKSINPKFTQNWIVLYANDELKGKGGYIWLCVAQPMGYLTNKQGVFFLEFEENPQTNQIWRFVLAK